MRGGVKMKKALMSLLVVSGLLVGGYLAIAPSPVWAECTVDNLQDPECKGKSLLPTSNICNTASECITWFVNAIFLIAVVLSFIYLVWGGIDYIMAGGDSGSADKARTKLTNAVIGLVVVIVAWAISNFILKFFGVQTQVPLKTGVVIEQVEG